MKNLDFEESCNCKFLGCKYYDYDNDYCLRDICIKLVKDERK